VTYVYRFPGIHLSGKQEPREASDSQKENSLAIHDGNVPRAVEALVNRKLGSWEKGGLNPERIAREAFRIMIRQIARERERLGR
jgi:hypothetical protein